MTVAIGLVCSDGVIVASDSMSSSGPTARPKCKVHAVADLGTIWTAAGAVYVIEEVEAVINDLANDPNAKQACSQPDFSAIRRLFGQHVRGKLRECYASALPFGTNQLLNNAFHPFISDFLLLGWSQEKPWFLEIAHDGQMNWHADARFNAVGSGGPFASVAQALMEHYLEGPSVPVDDGLLLAYRTIAATCSVSSGGVGMPVWLAIATQDGARVLTREEVDEVGTSVEGWKLVEKDAFTSLRAQPQEPDVGELPSLQDDSESSGTPGDT